MDKDHATRLLITAQNSILKLANELLFTASADVHNKLGGIFLDVNAARLALKDKPSLDE